MSYHTSKNFPFIIREYVLLNEVDILDCHTQEFYFKIDKFQIHNEMDKIINKYFYFKHINARMPTRLGESKLWC